MSSEFRTKTAFVRFYATKMAPSSLLFMSPTLSTYYAPQSYVTCLIAVNLVAVILRISKIGQVKSPAAEAPTFFKLYDRKVLCARTLNDCAMGPIYPVLVCLFFKVLKCQILDQRRRSVDKKSPHADHSLHFGRKSVPLTTGCLQRACLESERPFHCLEGVCQVVLSPYAMQHKMLAIYFNRVDWWTTIHAFFMPQ